MTTQHTHESNSQIPLRFARNIQERFEDFDRSHPEVLRTLVAMCFELQRAGVQRYGIRGLWERMRWELRVVRRAEGEPFALCDHMTSRYVRRIVAQYPQFADLFETRELRAK